MREAADHQVKVEWVLQFLRIHEKEVQVGG